MLSNLWYIYIFVIFKILLNVFEFKVMKRERDNWRKEREHHFVIIKSYCAQVYVIYYRNHFQISFSWSSHSRLFQFHLFSSPLFLLLIIHPKKRKTHSTKTHFIEQPKTFSHFKNITSIIWKSSKFKMKKLSNLLNNHGTIKEN